tara:strand:- start:74 stop:259 length:186 start_codon:yes stop_codon:yes gene_type:complete
MKFKVSLFMPEYPENIMDNRTNIATNFFLAPISIPYGDDGLVCESIGKMNIEKTDVNVVLS